MACISLMKTETRHIGAWNLQRYCWIVCFYFSNFQASNNQFTSVYSQIVTLILTSCIACAPIGKFLFLAFVYHFNWCLNFCRQLQVFTYFLAVSINRLKSIISVDYSIPKIIETCSPIAQVDCTRNLHQFWCKFLVYGKKKTCKYRQVFCRSKVTNMDIWDCPVEGESQHFFWNNRKRKRL